MSWSGKTRDAEVGGGGDIPNIPDDIYDAIIKDVSEPTTSVYDGKEREQFYITWELTSGDVVGESVRQYITLPEVYLNEGYLSEKSNLYKVMEALGFDLTGRFRVDPPSWQGMEARVDLEQERDRNGDPLRWPKVTKVKPKRQAKKQPVAAGAGARRRASDDDDDY